MEKERVRGMDPKNASLSGEVYHCGYTFLDLFSCPMSKKPCVESADASKFWLCGGSDAAAEQFHYILVVITVSCSISGQDLAPAAFSRL